MGRRTGAHCEDWEYAVTLPVIMTVDAAYFFFDIPQSKGIKVYIHWNINEKKTIENCYLKLPFKSNFHGKL